MNSAMITSKVIKICVWDLYDDDDANPRKFLTRITINRTEVALNRL